MSSSTNDSDSMNTGAPTYILPDDVMTTRESNHVITYIHYNTYIHNAVKCTHKTQTQEHMLTEPTYHHCH